ncbi:MAG: hypothetical protein ACI9YB_000587 [Halioglobus sp.]
MRFFCLARRGDRLDLVVEDQVIVEAWIPTANRIKCSSIFSFFLTDLSGSVVIYATTPFIHKQLQESVFGPIFFYLTKPENSTYLAKYNWNFQAPLVEKISGPKFRFLKLFVYKVVIKIKINCNLVFKNIWKL